jgi:hypothetical protein
MNCYYCQSELVEDSFGILCPNEECESMDGTTKLVISIDQTKRWYKNDQLHREDGPAVEYPNGSKCWYKNGKRHREDGPAIECSNGYKERWVNGNLTSCWRGLIVK